MAPVPINCPMLRCLPRPAAVASGKTSSSARQARDCLNRRVRRRLLHSQPLAMVDPTPRPELMPAPAVPAAVDPVLVDCAALACGVHLISPEARRAGPQRNALVLGCRRCTSHRCRACCRLPPRFRALPPVSHRSLIDAHFSEALRAGLYGCSRVLRDRAGIPDAPDRPPIRNPSPPAPSFPRWAGMCSVLVVLLVTRERRPWRPADLDL